MNVYKTQLICFRSQSTRPCSATISFNGTVLCYLDYVTHLGHILSDRMAVLLTLGACAGGLRYLVCPSVRPSVRTLI